jgi:hypothetical protein
VSGPILARPDRAKLRLIMSRPTLSHVHRRMNARLPPGDSRMAEQVAGALFIDAVTVRTRGRQYKTNGNRLLRPPCGQASVSRLSDSGY